MTEKAKIIIGRAAEGGHWYQQDGQLVAQVLKADKSGYTDTTLRQARKLDLGPGVTTITRCADKPNLTLWKQRQAVLSALTLPRRETESEGDYIKRIEEDMNATAKKAAEEGTRMHAAIQACFQGEPYEDAMQPVVGGAMQLLEQSCGPQPWQAEVAGTCSFGVGTKIDLISHGWIIDWKGKDGSQQELNELKTYEDHWMQLAIGRVIAQQTHGLFPERAAIGFLSRTHPGACALREVTKAELDRGLKMFRALLRYWQVKNDYRPSWCKEEP